jgi:hypothetical protein
MSGYDPRSGWTHLTPTALHRYWNPHDDSDSVTQRLETHELSYYWDAAGGIHAHCAQATLYEALTGEVASRGRVATPGTETEWISVTDLGANFDPRLSTSAVLSRLRAAGLLTRTDRRDVPTDAAIGLYEERPAEQSGRFPPKPGAVQRRWAFEVLGRIRSID